jgi:endonuclease I
MDVRYEDALDGNDLELVDRTTGGEAVTLGRLCALLLWHHLDPVDIFERRRHARIVALQGNHNPFISEPALAELLYGPRCPAPPVS